MKNTIAALAVALLTTTASAGPFDFKDIKGVSAGPMQMGMPEGKVTNVGTTPNSPKRVLLGPQGDPVPSVSVPAGSQAEGMPLAPLLRSLTKGTGLNAVVAPGLANTPVSRAAGVVGGRMLVDVLDELSDDMGFFYRVQGSTLYVEPTRRFEQPLPPIEDFTKTVTEQMKDLGATGVVFNQFSNRISFTASRNVAQVIEDYLRSLDRALIPVSFEVVVVEMSARATDSFQLRIDKALSAVTSSGQYGLTNTQGGVSGAVRMAGGWVFKNGASLEALVDILATQGTVSDFKKTIVSTTSGIAGEAKFTRTEKYFITQKGEPGANGQVGQATATEKEVPIGLSVKLKPTVQDGLVWTDVSIELTDLVRYESITLDNNQQRIPIQSQRSSTAKALTLRPGELFVMTALTTGRDTVDTSGLPAPLIGLLPTAKEGAKDRSNLVVMLRPILGQPSN